MKWYPFDKNKGSRQKRPPERRYVLVRLASRESGLPQGIAVGYLKNAAGDKQCPYFVVPGLHTGTALAWCDCLPDGFEWPAPMAEDAVEWWHKWPEEKPKAWTRCIVEHTYDNGEPFYCIEVIGESTPFVKPIRWAEILPPSEP